MKRKFLCSYILAIMFFVAGLGSVCGQTATEQSVTDPAEIEKLRGAIEKTPDDLELHEKYQKAVGRRKWDTPEFIAQYEAWMKKFPKSATVAYALGHALESLESPKAKPYLLKAVERDPKFAKAYFALWGDGERRGDFKASNAYLLKAKEADPKNADYAFYYASGLSNSDPEQYKKLSLEVARDFPNTERGAQALYWLAARTKDVKEKTIYYEQLRKDFPADKFNWSSSGMSGYFSLLLIQEPDKAVELADYMIGLKPDDRNWKSNKEMATDILQVKLLMKDGKAADAAVIMEKLVTPRSSKELLLLKAKTLDAAGKTEKAYQSLLVEYAKEPASVMEKEMISYGSKLGKNATQVDKDVWYIRDTASKVAPVFVLDQYFKKGTASLADYKGKVVLVTYWFPGCGPCRGEFPHFENVVRKFKEKEFVYLGINIVSDQDEYVVPFLKSSGYSFIPLRDNKNWQKGPLDNRGAAPVNFLIDQNGKIIFSRFRTDDSNEATLEKMISSMLERQKKT